MHKKNHATILIVILLNSSYERVSIYTLLVKQIKIVMYTFLYPFMDIQCAFIKIKVAKSK